MLQLPSCCSDEGSFEACSEELSEDFVEIVFSCVRSSYDAKQLRRITQLETQFVSFFEEAKEA